MIVKCHECRKVFDILWPDHWVYKTGKTYFCSWKCLRAREQQHETVKERKGMKPNAKVPPEIQEQAVRAAIEGGDPFAVLEPYSENPRKYFCYMKAQLKKKDPETYAKIPDLRTKEAKSNNVVIRADDVQKAVEEQDDAETESISAPLRFEDFTVTEIRRNFGRYRRSDIHGTIYIDFEAMDGGDVMSYTLDQWSEFIRELKRGAQVLGVMIHD